MRAPNAAQMKMIEWRGLLPRKFLNRVQSRIWRNNSPPYMFWSFPSQHRGKVMVPVIASEKLERAHVQGSHSEGPIGQRYRQLFSRGLASGPDRATLRVYGA